MSFLAWLVKTILNTLEIDIPWRAVGSVLVAVLLLVAYTDRSDFMSGVHAWTVEAGCQADHEILNALSGDKQMPRMQVAKAGGVCIVKPIQPTQSGPGPEPHP